MEEIAKLTSALATLAWPVLFGILFFKLFEPIRSLVDSARARKFSIKVAGNELTVEEASEQQRILLKDLQTKMAEMEKHVHSDHPNRPTTPEEATSRKRILWVDDNPKNNSYQVADLEERGAHVDIVLSTDEAIAKVKKQPYDIVISDMGRPENEKAGIDLANRIRQLRLETPIFIYCGPWAATNFREEALAAGVNTITSSATTLLGALPLK